MFIQIEDPSYEVIQEEAVGIDFGTTYSLVAYFDGQTSHVLKDNKGTIIIPTALYEKEGCIHVCEDIASVHHHERLIFSIKRLMNAADDPAFYGKSPIELASVIFKYLKDRACCVIPHLTSCVISVPAYFQEPQRMAIKTAAEMAGWKVLRLINEPTAAAIAFGLDLKTQGTFLVYDFGGGTFDVSLLRLNKGVFHILGSGGDAHLGGDDIDRAILDYFKRPQTNKDYLWARYIKQEVQLPITSDILKEISLPLIEKTISICRDVLQDAHMTPVDIDAIILVGGSTRLSFLSDLLTKEFNRPVLNSMSPDEAVAIGAAFQARNLTHVLLDICPLSLGIEMHGGIVDKIIPRNSPIPISMAQNFTTAEAHHSQMVLHIVQGEREFAKDCMSLGKFVMKNLPPMSQIQVTFRLDGDGLLHVEAIEKKTQQKIDIDMKPTFGLTHEDIKHHIYEGHQHGAEDMENRLRHQDCLNGSKLASYVSQALLDYGALLNPNNKIHVESLLKELQCHLHQQDRARIHESIKALSVASQRLAEIQIEESIKKVKLDNF
jgi:molecular chaperone HscA